MLPTLCNHPVPNYTWWHRGWLRFTGNSCSSWNNQEEIKWNWTEGDDKIKQTSVSGIFHLGPGSVIYFCFCIKSLNDLTTTEHFFSFLFFLSFFFLHNLKVQWVFCCCCAYFCQMMPIKCPMQKIDIDQNGSSVSRPCVQCAWTGWRTWSACVAMAPASCAGTEWASAPLPQGHRAPHPPLLEAPPPKRLWLSFLLKLSPTTPASATALPAACAARKNLGSTCVSQPRASTNVLFYATYPSLNRARTEFRLQSEGGKERGKQKKHKKSWLFLIENGQLC